MANKITKFLKSKKAKGLLLVMLLCAFLSTSGYSFAKYYDEYKENEAAQLAKFGEVDVDFTTNTVSFNEGFPTGWYAFTNEVRIHFSSAEVSRKYTVKVKAVATDVDASNFKTVPAYENSKFSLEASSTVYTVVKNNKNEYTSTSSNVASTLTNGSITSFAANTVYMSDTDGYRDPNATVSYNWKAYQASMVSAATEGVLTLHSNHTIAPNEEDYHYVNFIYFVHVTDSSNPISYKFIYSLNVEQVI